MTDGGGAGDAGGAGGGWLGESMTDWAPASLAFG